MTPTTPQVACTHATFHSPQGRYERERAVIRYVTVCDDCGAETREVLSEPYSPSFDPAGNDPYISRN